MATYIICYDLTKPEQDYPDLITAIEAYSAARRIQKSVWLVTEDKDTSEIFDALNCHIAKPDKLFIAKISAPDIVAKTGTGAEGKEIVDWFKNFMQWAGKS